MTGDLSASSLKLENMHVFIPHNHCVCICDNLTNSSPTQDTILEAEEQVIINAMKEPDFHIKRDFKKLLSTITLSAAEHKQRDEVAALKKKLVEDAKLERWENAKKKKTDGATKTNGTDSKNVKAAQSISEDHHAEFLQPHQPQPLQAQIQRQVLHRPG